MKHTRDGNAKEGHEKHESKVLSLPGGEFGRMRDSWQNKQTKKRESREMCFLLTSIQSGKFLATSNNDTA